MLQFVEVSTCDMEKGHLRCDANVSVRLKGAEKFGTKAEVKNLNSFRFLKLALDYEIARQVALLESGGRVVQETRLYNPDTGETVQHAQQGRRARLSLLSRARPGAAARSATSGSAGCPARDAGAARRASARASSTSTACANTTPRCSPPPAPPASTSRRPPNVSGDPKTAANWVMGDLMGAAQGRRQRDRGFAGAAAEHLGELVELIAAGRDLRQAGQRDFPEDVRHRRAGRRHHGARRSQADQRHRRAREDHRRSDRRTIPSRWSSTRAARPR